MAGPHIDPRKRQSGTGGDGGQVGGFPMVAIQAIMEELTVKTSPHRSVLKKIAARRGRAESSDARPPWASFLADASSETGRSGRIPALMGPRILTRRETEVLRFVAKGETDQRIADRLYLSRRTINSHVSNILAKLDVPSRREAVIAAARIGLL